MSSLAAHWATWHSHLSRPTVARIQRRVDFHIAQPTSIRRPSTKRVRRSSGISTALRRCRREEKCVPQGAADISFVRRSRIKENAFLRRESGHSRFAAGAPETI
jgi:hypothetical protein